MYKTFGNPSPDYYFGRVHPFKATEAAIAVAEDGCVLGGKSNSLFVNLLAPLERSCKTSGEIFLQTHQCIFPWGKTS